MELKKVPLNKSMTRNSETACIFVITLTSAKWQCVVPTFHEGIMQKSINGGFSPVFVHKKRSNVYMNN